jgi:hypothetical protein
MPYDAEKGSDVGSMKDKLKATYASVSDTAARQAIHIFNSVMKEHSDEGRAWAGVYSKMNERLSKKAGQEKTSGFFSWQCLGCGRSLLSSNAVDRGNDFGWMTDVVAVFQDGSVVKGEYDGYGRIDGSGPTVEVVDDMWGKDGPSLWHEACWKKKGRPSWKGPSPSARDQGFFIDESEYQGAVPGRRASAGETMPFPPEMLEAIERVATKHPEHAETLRSVAKEAAWVPGELSDPDEVWQTGELDPTPFVHVEEGSQVPPKRDNNGNQLNEDDKPIDSIPRVRAKASGRFDWDDDRIVEYYDDNPDATLRDLARMTGRTVSQLKKLLMGGRRAGTADDAWARLARVVQSPVEREAASPRWKFHGRLHKPDGHKLYQDTETGDYAIADNSGRHPDETDDGILWLTMNQKLELDMGQQGRPWVSVKLTDDDGRKSMTGTNLDGALFLADKFKWTVTLVSPEGRKIKLQ